MKKLITLLALAAIFAFPASKANAAGVPYSTAYENLATVVDLPNDSTSYDEEEDSYFNLSYFYKQVWIAWIPLWNYDGKYCVTYESDSETYYTISDEQLQWFVDTYELGKLPENPIPFWDKIGGKLLVLGIIGGAILLSRMGGKKDDDDEEPKKEE